MASARPNSSAWRFLLPSVRDIVFISLFWSILAGPLSNRPLADPDIGWHIRTGERILATHALPRTDPFSSTMQGQPWFAWEWLYDLLLGILHRACGLNGVVWLCAVLVAATFTLLVSQLLRRGSGLPLATVLMLLAVAAATIHLYARPHIVSWLFSLVWFVVLEKWEKWERCEHATLPRWLPWFFPASMLLWVNLHGGWLFGLALLGIYTFAAFVESWRERDASTVIRDAHRARAMAVAWLASVLATLANPFGWRLHAHIYRYLGDRYLMSHIEEFRSPDFHGWAERCFAVILVLTLIAFANHRTKLRISHLLVVLLAAYAGFYSSRNLPVSSMLLVLIVGPMLWENFAALADKPEALSWLRNGSRPNFELLRPHGRAGTRVSRPPVADCCGGLCVGDLPARRMARLAATNPCAIRSQESAGRGGEVFYKKNLWGSNRVLLTNALPNDAPIFSTDAWGGYLIYRMYPARKVVVDDRHDLYGSGRIRQYMVLTQGQTGWQSVLDQWQIRTALLPTDSTLANLLRERPQDWQVAYEDKVAVVFEKR